MIFYAVDYLKIALNQNGYYSFEKFLPSRGGFPLCPACSTRIGPKLWHPPFRATLIGDHAGDLCCGTCQELLVSRRFVNAWKDSGLSGLRISDDAVEIRPSEGLPEESPEFFVAFPKYTITRLDEVASGLEIHKLVGCDVCRGAQRARVRRIRIDESSWEGWDIFYPSGLYGHLLVTERFRLFVEEHAFTNFEFIHQDTFHEERKLA